MKTKGIIFLICLFVCTGMAFAQGGGGFTSPNSDAGWNAQGGSQKIFDNEINFSQSGDATGYCAGNLIWTWYDTAVNSYYPPCLNIPVGTRDADGDGCLDITEFCNLYVQYGKQPPIQCNGKVNLLCACGNNYCDTGENWENCNKDCLTECVTWDGKCNPELGENYFNGNGCNDGCTEFSWEESIDSIPEFNGTAIILLAILVLIAALLQGHFHKK